MESRLNIPVPPKTMGMGVQSYISHVDRWFESITLRGVLVGKSVSKAPESVQGEASCRTDDVRHTFKKYSLLVDGDRTKTDTGG